MNLRISFLAVMLSACAFGQAIPGSPADAFQVRYASNLNVGDSVINITNAGTANTVTGALSNICVNVYTFSPDEQQVSCCACNVTPQRAGFPVGPQRSHQQHADAAIPDGHRGQTGCHAPGDLQRLHSHSRGSGSGMRAWGTTIHAAPRRRYPTR
jgi:hypothetical protein